MKLESIIPVTFEGNTGETLLRDLGIWKEIAKAGRGLDLTASALTALVTVLLSIRGIMGQVSETVIRGTGDVPEWLNKAVELRAKNNELMNDYSKSRQKSCDMLNEFAESRRRRDRERV